MLEPPTPSNSPRPPSGSPGRQPWPARTVNIRHRGVCGVQYEGSSDDQLSSGTTTEDWERWSDITLRLDGLPPETETAHLFEWFSKEGRIAWIDIFASQSQLAPDRPVSAKIRFEPPPKRNFWANGKYVVRHPNRQQYPSGLTISVAAPRNPPQQWIRSTNDPERIYPIQIKLRLQSLDIGVQMGNDCMKTMKTVDPVKGRDFRLELNTRSKTISAYFSLPAQYKTWSGTRDFRFKVDIASMKTIHRTALDKGSCSLVMPLSLPPQYFFKNEDPRKTMSTDLKTWSLQDTWYRTTDVSEDLLASFKYPVALHSDVADPEYMEVGRWTTFRFVLETNSSEAMTSAQQLRFALEDFNIMYKDSPNFEITPRDKPLIWTLLDHPPVAQTHGGALALLKSTSQVIHLEFPVRYQLEVCISRGILNEYTISEEFLLKLSDMDPIKARLRLEFFMDQNIQLQNPMSLFTNPDAEAYYPNPRLPHYCTLVRKATVTPTTIRFNTPNAETSNRVMRKYNLLQDRFLRVQFLEESEQSRIGMFKDQNDALYTRLLRTVHQGIRIGDRHYEFLAFGSSQLRECGAYFFCPTNNTSCDDIREWMGQFDHIKVVAKYAARLGQCFSTTREIRGIHVPRIREIPDIERNGYCFSDGVGIISAFLARIIIEEMELDVFDEPSAFQFRMGGCKGVLTVWPQAKGMEVLIRQSQEKFKTALNNLEIIRCAKLATATLNRQTITILECLGVPPIAFLDLLDYQLHRFENAMKDKSVAVELLTQFVDENQVTLVIAELLKSNFIGDGLSEPFVTSIISLWRSWSLKLLKEKARIQVDQSAFVLGCVDETGSLRGHFIATEGSKEQDINKLPQIFLQLSDPKNYNKTNIIQGVCIVGRNPSLHPGDIRVVQAVDEPKLHHLKDVVVFSSTGDRPVPNMLSGGDLDGDDFFVIWDRTLIPKEWNHPPMNYSASKSIERKEGVTVNDIKNFFVSYVKNDVLPLVAVSHLGFADELGPKSKLCLELADMHSQAVDFPKTGEPVKWSRRFQPRRWPHFMEKKHSYPSKKVLGRIYDKISRQPVEFRPDWEDEFDPRILGRFKFDNEMLKAARKIKLQYDTSVRRILAQHNVGTEFELWTGFAMSKPAVGSDYKRQEHLGREYDALKQRFREMCYEAAGGHNPDKIDPFVAAMYKVTEEQIKIALFEHNRGPVNEGGHIVGPRRLETRSMPLLSFPWIFHWVMIRIAQGAKYDGRNSMLAPARRRNQPQFHRNVKVHGNIASAEGSGASAMSQGDASEGLNIAAGRHDHDSESTSGDLQRSDDVHQVGAAASLIDEGYVSTQSYEKEPEDPSTNLISVSALPARVDDRATGTSTSRGLEEFDTETCHPLDNADIHQHEHSRSTCQLEHECDTATNRKRLSRVTLEVDRSQSRTGDDTKVQRGEKSTGPHEEHVGETAESFHNQGVGGSLMDRLLEMGMNG
ncbi:hypothetical protein ACO1O0_005435 [Amphichorda felina]